MLPALLPHFRHPLFDWRIQIDASDWLTVLHTHVQSRFHVFLMICKKGCRLLAIQFCAHELRMSLTFPTLPLRGLIKLGPCDRCFWAGMDSFPIHRLSLNILRQFWAQCTVSPQGFAHFFLKGLNSCSALRLIARITFSVHASFTLYVFPGNKASNFV